MLQIHISNESYIDSKEINMKKLQNFLSSLVTNII
jgi:hypothetical protein